MMAYENTNLNNAPYVDFCDPFESSNLEGKLTTANMQVNGLAAQMQPGFINGINSCQQQANNLTSLQMQVNSQLDFNYGMNMNNIQNNAMTMNSFQPTTLMNSMVMQQPFFQANFQQQQQQQQQQSRGIPNFISFQSDDSAMNPKPLPTSFEPNCVQSIINTDKPLFGGLEPLPVIEKSEQAKNEQVKASNTCMSHLPRSICKSKRLLPADFQPSGNYVICGNKRKYFESKGNIRFREVCKVFLHEYVQAPTKIEKSAVVTKVMNILREDCPEGAFVSPQGGRWYAVSERTAREKVGTYFRDCLSDSYKSSAKNKIARRKIIKKAAASANSSSKTSESNHSDDGSLGSISFYDVDDLTPVPL